MKEPKPKSPAAIYCCLYQSLSETAQKCGYALAAHGSLQRDFDLIAVPWTEHATSEEVLMQHFAGICGANSYWLKEQRSEKLHGRIAHTILLDYGTYLDISVLPRNSHDQK